MFYRRFKSNYKIKIHFDWLKKYLSTGNKDVIAPICLEIDPSNRCPLNCQHCYWKNFRASSRAQLPEERLLSLVNEAAELGVKSIIWTGGGEPLSNQATCKAVMLSHSLGLEKVCLLMEFCWIKKKHVYYLRA